MRKAAQNEVCANSAGGAAIRHFLFFPTLLFFAVEAAAEVPALSEANAVLKSLSDGKVRNIVLENNAADWKESEPDYYIHSFETPTTCRNFELSKAEVREFFKHARVLTDEFQKTIKKGPSRCIVSGSAETPDGRNIVWQIDRARNGTLYFSKTPGGAANQKMKLFFDKCRSNKFEPIKGDYRPVIKSLAVKESGVQRQDIGPGTSYDPDACKHFKLSETEVRDFLRIARASARAEFNSTYTIGTCYTSGEAVLQNGREATWQIDEGGHGTINFPGDGTLWFFCDKCSTKKFPGLCLEDDCRG